MQPDGQLKDKPGGNEKGFLGGEKLAKAAGQKVLQALKVLGQPSIAAGFAADELSEGNIKTAGASLLAPELVGSFAPAGKGILSTIGRLAANPFGKAVRAFTPVGLLTIGAGMGKDVYDEYKRREALTDEERLAEDLEAQEKFDEAMIGAAEGGRIGFKDGDEVDQKRRMILKGMGIMSLLPFGLGKLFKTAEKATPVMTEGVKLGFDNFMTLVDKIKKLGKQTDGVTQTEREVGYVYTGKNGNQYELVEDLTTGDIRVTKDKVGIGSYDDKTFDIIEDRSTFVLRKGEEMVDPKTKKYIKTQDEYDEMKELADQDGTYSDADTISDEAVEEVLDEIN